MTGNPSLPEQKLFKSHQFIVLFLIHRAQPDPVRRAYLPGNGAFVHGSFPGTSAVRVGAKPEWRGIDNSTDSGDIPAGWKTADIQAVYIEPAAVVAGTVKYRGHMVPYGGIDDLDTRTQNKGLRCPP
jgi:hypothetical protein